MPNTQPTVIRPARAQDAERIAVLCGQLGYPASHEQVRRRLDQIQQDDEQAVYVAQRPDGHVIGWVQIFVRHLLVVARHAELGGLIVDEGHREGGVGRLLMERAEEWAREKKCESVYVRSNVVRERAHRFYERIGYANVKTSLTFRKDMEWKMSVTCTNRKGRTYHLCKGVTKTGKPRYYFAREPKGEPVEQIPEGYEISESVNGVVSLVKARPAQILPQERAAVEAAVQRHPKSRNYRVDVKQDRIEVYEQVGSDLGDVLTALFKEEMGMSHLANEINDWQSQHARFTPVLRFVLHDAETRSFGAQRMCYRGRIDGWIDLSTSGSLEEMARRLVPTLGSDRFFELF